MKITVQKKQPAVKPPPSPLTTKDKVGNGIVEAALKTAPLAEGNVSRATGFVKRALAIAGFDPGNRDWTFTPELTAAVKSFQTAEGLPVTGVVDLPTYKKMEGVILRVRSKRPFGVGQKGKQIVRMTQELRKLGYEVDGNGVFGQKDLAALAKLAKDEGKKKFQKTPTALTKTVQNVLDECVKAEAHREYRQRVKPSAAQHQIDNLTAQAVMSVDPSTGVAGVGPTNGSAKVIANIQHRLRAAGYYPRNQKGAWGDRMTGAVKVFQNKNGLPATGVVDKATWAKLSKSFIFTTDSTSPAQSFLERGGAVKHTQKLLKAAGFKGVRESGIFDAKTRNAVRAFQKAQKLSVTGEVNGKTFAALKKAASWHAGSWKPGPGQLYGADTSMWESDSQFLQSISGAKWSAIKATEGTDWNDPTFQRRWKILGERVSSGQMKLRMAYLFMHPGNAVGQAKHFLSALGINGKLKPGTRLCLDWEGAAFSDPGGLRDAANYIHGVTGVWPVVYVQGSMMNEAKAFAPNCPIWEAAYGSGINRNVPFFQYSDGPGWDHDVFNGDLTALERFAGWIA